MLKVGDRLYNMSPKITFNVDNPVLINFFATWCGPCVQELPDMQHLYNMYKDKVQFVFIHCGGNENDVTTFLKQKNISLPVVIDDDNSIRQQFNVLSIPFAIITDCDKIVKKTIVEARSYEDYEQELKTILI